MTNPFDDVIGHRPIVDMLTTDAARPSHAYLFVGPASLGKATVARRFAAALLCGDDPGCIRRVLGDGHPDLTLVEPDGRTVLTVDRARETVARSVLAPVEAARKVFIFEEAGAMTEEAANALLKTLEEPSPTTVFILVAESEDELPLTIASRARSIVFGRIPDAEVAAALEARGIEAPQAEGAAAASGGRPGLALMLATKPHVAAFRSAWLSVPGRVTSRPGDAFRLADELVSAAEPLLEGLTERQSAELGRADGEGREMRSIRERHERERRRAVGALHVGGLEILASWYRDAAAAQFGAPVRNQDIPGTDLAGMSPRDAVVKARRVLDTIDSLNTNQRPELAFSALFADLGTPA